MMAKREVLNRSHIATSFLVLLSSLTLTFQVPLHPKEELHVILKRSHPPDSLQQPHSFEDHHSLHQNNRPPPMRMEETAPAGHFSEGHVEEREEERMREALAEQGLTRVIFDEETFLSEDDYYDQDEEGPGGHGNVNQEPSDKEYHRKKMTKKFSSDQDESSDFHKKHPLSKGHDHPKESEESEEEHTKMDELDHVSVITSSAEETDRVTEPSLTSYQSGNGKHPSGSKDNPIVLPVTTEGKNNGVKVKTEDPLIVYGFPKELLPIMPGGGSRFEDVEREKLEKKKMSQTKGGDDDSAESGSSHEAEGLYSSASLSSMSLCFYWLISFHYIDRILLL